MFKMVTGGNGRSVYCGVIAPAVFSFSEGFVPCFDCILAEQYAVCEKKMWRFSGDVCYER